MIPWSSGCILLVVFGEKKSSVTFDNFRSTGCTGALSKKAESFWNENTIKIDCTRAKFFLLDAHRFSFCLWALIMRIQSVKIVAFIQKVRVRFHMTSNLLISKFLKHRGCWLFPVPDRFAHRRIVYLSFERFPVCMYLWIRPSTDLEAAWKIDRFRRRYKHRSLQSPLPFFNGDRIDLGTLTRQSTKYYTMTVFEFLEPFIRCFECPKMVKEYVSEVTR